MAQPRQSAGYASGRCKARRLMRPAGVAVRPAKRCTVPTDSRPGDPIAPHRLARQCAVEPPTQAWAGEMTSLWPAAGWVWVAVVLDVSSRTVVGWAVSSRLSAALVQEALGLALGRRGPAAGLMHHAERGSQYACHDYQGLLAAHASRCRLRRKGDGVDKAVVDRFFGSLQRARPAPRQYATRREAKTDVIEDIERFYNSTRQHADRGSVSPNEFEAIARVA
jgi:putative transposase